MAMDRDTIRTLAQANGLTIPEERLDLVLRQYQAFLRTLEKLESVPLPREAEPATLFSATGAIGAPDVSSGDTRP
jgi:hypothetical protein